MEHKVTISSGRADFLKGQAWYICSCGSSGSACKTQAAALEAFQKHSDAAEAADRLERIRDAAPALLSTLEQIGKRANSQRLGTAGVLSAEFHLHEIEREARAAILAAKGD